jgi:DNA/RNA-binding domain of Phe-tRNA-synthetase-like protein
MLQATIRWRQEYPNAAVGLMTMSGVANPECDDRLEARKAALEEQMRATYATREELTACQAVGAYREYYKRFDKTYPVLLQMESVAVKGKRFPRAAALVEAMFMAEVKNGLLTAGHDLDVLAAPLTLDVADGEGYTGISGREQATKAGDMLIRDRAGIISSIICGPDHRTRITAATTRALFVVYAPQGVERAMIERHFDDIAANVLLIAPGARIEYRGIIS